MYYVFDDFIKSSAAEFYESKRAIYLEDGHIKEIPLAFRSTIYSDQDKSPVITTKDAEGNEITEEEYDTITDKYFTNLEKRR